MFVCAFDMAHFKDLQRVWGVIAYQTRIDDLAPRNSVLTKRRWILSDRFVHPNRTTNRSSDGCVEIESDEKGCGVWSKVGHFTFLCIMLEGFVNALTMNRVGGGFLHVFKDSTAKR